MGNKISIGRFVIYLGFAKKRRKTKQKEEEKRQRMFRLERFEAYIRGERFKAAYPEYCRQAGLLPEVDNATTVAKTCSSEDSGSIHKIDILQLSESDVRKDDEDLHLGFPAQDKSYDSEDSVFSRGKLPPSGSPVYSLKSFSDDVASAWSMEDPLVTPCKEDSSVSEEKSVVPAKQLAVPAVPVVLAEKHQDQPVPGEDFLVTKENSLVTEHHPLTLEKEKGPSLLNKLTPKAEKDTVVDSERTLTSAENSSIVLSDKAPSVPDNYLPVPDIHLSVPDACDKRSYSTGDDEESEVVFPFNNKDNDATTNAPLSSLRGFKPRFNSTLKPVEPRSGVEPCSRVDPKLPQSGSSRTLSEESSVRLPVAPPATQTSLSLRPPPPIPPRPLSPSLKTASCCFRAASPPSRHPSRSVAFADPLEEFDGHSSSDELQEKDEDLSLSPPSSSEELVPLQKTNLPPSVAYERKEVQNGAPSGIGQLSDQHPGNSSGTRSQRDALVKLKSPRGFFYHPSPPPSRGTSRCVYNSGFPSLVGDRIESASEDEEFWAKKLTIVGPTRPLTRHVFCGNSDIVGHNLIPGSQLAKHFNEKDLAIYLKERRQQCNLYHYGVSAVSCNVQYQTRLANSRMLPEGLKNPSCMESTAVLSALKNLHDELKKFHQDTSRHLGTGLPRLIHSIERRQSCLESRVDMLESRKVVMEFQEPGEGSVQQQLKALRQDLQTLNQLSAQKRAKPETKSKAISCYIPDEDKDIQIEDIEDDASVSVSRCAERTRVMSVALTASPALAEAIASPSLAASAPALSLKRDHRQQRIQEQNRAILEWIQNVHEAREKHSILELGEPSKAREVNDKDCRKRHKYKPLPPICSRHGTKPAQVAESVAHEERRFDRETGTASSAPDQDIHRGRRASAAGSPGENCRLEGNPAKVSAKEEIPSSPGNNAKVSAMKVIPSGPGTPAKVSTVEDIPSCPGIPAKVSSGADIPSRPGISANIFTVEDIASSPGIQAKVSTVEDIPSRPGIAAKVCTVKDILSSQKISAKVSTIENIPCSPEIAAKASAVEDIQSCQKISAKLSTVEAIGSSPGIPANVSTAEDIPSSSGIWANVFIEEDYPSRQKFSAKNPTVENILSDQISSKKDDHSDIVALEDNCAGKGEEERYDLNISKATLTVKRDVRLGREERFRAPVVKDGTQSDQGVISKSYVVDSMKSGVNIQAETSLVQESTELAEPEILIANLAVQDKAKPGVEENLSESFSVEEGLSQPLGVEENLSQHFSVKENLSQPLGVGKNLSQPFSVKENVSQPLGAEENLSEPISAEENLSQPLGVDESLSQPISVEEDLSQPLGVEENLSQPFSVKENLSQPLGVEENLSEPFSVGEDLSQPIGVKESLSQPFSVEEDLSQPLGVEENLSEPFSVEEDLSQPLGVEEELQSGTNAASDNSIVEENLHFQPKVSSRIPEVKEELQTSPENSTRTGSEETFCSRFEVQAKVSKDIPADPVVSVEYDAEISGDNIQPCNENIQCGSTNPPRVGQKKTNVLRESICVDEVIQSEPEIPATTSVTLTDQSESKSVAETHTAEADIQAGQEVLTEMPVVENTQSVQGIPSEVSFVEEDFHSDLEAPSKGCVVEEHVSSDHVVSQQISVHSEPGFLDGNGSVQEELQLGKKNPEGTSVDRENIDAECKLSVEKSHVQSGAKIPSEASFVQDGIKSSQETREETSIAKDIQSYSEIPSETSFVKEIVQSERQNPTATSVAEDIQSVIVSPSVTSANQPESKSPESAFSVEEDIQLDTEISSEASFVDEEILSEQQSSTEASVPEDIQSESSIPSVTLDIRPQSETLAEASILREVVQSSTDTPRKTSLVDKNIQPEQQNGENITVETVIPSANQELHHITETLTKASLIKEVVRLGTDAPPKTSFPYNNIQPNQQSKIETSTIEGVNVKAIIPSAHTDLQPKPETPTEASIPEESVHSDTEILSEASFVEENTHTEQETRVDTSISEELQSEIETPSVASTVYHGLESSSKSFAVEKSCFSGPVVFKQTVVKGILSNPEILAVDVQNSEEESASHTEIIGPGQHSKQRDRNHPTEAPEEQDIQSRCGFAEKDLILKKDLQPEAVTPAVEPAAVAESHHGTDFASVDASSRFPVFKPVAENNRHSTMPSEVDPLLPDVKTASGTVIQCHTTQASQSGKGRASSAVEGENVQRDEKSDKSEFNQDISPAISVTTESFYSDATVSPDLQVVEKRVVLSDRRLTTESSVSEDLQTGLDASVIDLDLSVQLQCDSERLEENSVLDGKFQSSEETLAIKCISAGSVKIHKTEDLVSKDIQLGCETSMPNSLGTTVLKSAEGIFFGKKIDPKESKCDAHLEVAGASSKDPKLDSEEKVTAPTFPSESIQSSNSSARDVIAKEVVSERRSLVKDAHGQLGRSKENDGTSFKDPVLKKKTSDTKVALKSGSREDSQQDTLTKSVNKTWETIPNGEVKRESAKEVGNEKDEKKIEEQDDEEDHKSDVSETLSDIARQLYLDGYDSSKKPKPKRVAPDSSSHAMMKLNEIKSKLPPNKHLQEVAARKALWEEHESQEREESSWLYRNKQPGLRNLEKFRDEILYKPTEFVEQVVSPEEYFQHLLDFENVVPGVSAERLETSEMWDRGRNFISDLERSGSSFGEPSSNGSILPRSQGTLPRRGTGSVGALPAIGSSLPSLEQNFARSRESLRKPKSLMESRLVHKTNDEPLKQNIPWDPYYEDASNFKRCPPAFEDDMIAEDCYEDFRENIELGHSASGIIDESGNLGYAEPVSDYSRQPSSPSDGSVVYRTPETRKPAALVPLNMGQLKQKGSGRDVSSKVASLEAALGFTQSSDPWKPAPLPGITKSTTGVVRPDDPLLSVVPKPKPIFPSSSLSAMKPPVLPGIARRPLPGIGSGKNISNLQTTASLDRAI